jgi:uncharacterized protein (UPF0335 family)
MSIAASIAADHLRSLVARIERLEAEIKELNADKTEIYAEAKSTGFDKSVLKKLIAERRKPASERAEQDALLDLYREALAAPPLRVHEAA